MENDQMMNDLLDTIYRTGSVELMQQALDQGWGINDDWGGATMLYQCSGAGHYDLVEYLLNNGADPFITTDYDSSYPITCAFDNKHFKVCELLVNHCVKKGI